jgi:type I restriction enzyme, S subunit
VTVTRSCAQPLWTVLHQRNDFGEPALPLLTVISDYGVRLRDLADGRQPSEDLAGYRVVRTGDLVVNKMWARFGAYGVAEQSGIVSPAYWVLKLRTEIVYPRFLHYLLRSSAYRAEIWKRSKDLPPNGFDLPWDQFRTIPVCLPEIADQRVIVNYLNRETARIDALVKAKKCMAALLDERFARQVSRLLFEHTPHNLVRLKFICGLPTSGNRDHGSFTYTSVGVPCLRGVDLSNDDIDLSGVLRIPTEDSKRHVNTKLHTGDLVIVRSGATAGRSALVMPELDGSNCVDLVVVRRTPKLEPRYLAYIVQSQEIQNRVLHEFSGALQPHFNAVDAGEIELPMRPVEEQTRIADILDERASAKRLMTNVLNSQIAALQRRRDALIASAVSGPIDIPGVV